MPLKNVPHKGYQAVVAINEVAQEGTATVESTALVVADAPREVSLGRAIHSNVRFASSALMTSDEPGPRRLTWLTGNNQCFAPDGKTAMPPAKGFFLDMPVEEDGLLPGDYQLMDAMEILCERGIAVPCIVVHQADGKPSRVPSWSLPAASLFVICQGVPSKAEMLQDVTARWGIAYGWNALRGRTELNVQCFVKELLDAGYNGAFDLKFSGQIVDKAISALKAHEYVLRFADRLRQQAGEEQGVPYYAYALHLRCSASTLTVGRNATTEVYYPVPTIPRLSQRDMDSAIAFLDAMAITEDQAFLIEENGRVERAVEWSVNKSRQIITGNDASDVSADTTNEAPF